MTDTIDGAALLAAIRAHPAEDTPRLAYADYLQEQGEDARAEFIRVQVSLANFGCSHDAGRIDCACYWPRLRELALLTHAAKANLPWTPDGLTYWLKAKPTGLALRDQQYLVGLFVRGMIEDVTGSAANWLQHADAILAAHPVRKVTLTTLPEVNVINASSGASATARFQGRQRTVSVYRDGRVAGLVGALLHAEWPGIEFELPKIITLSADGLADPYEFIRNHGNTVEQALANLADFRERLARHVEPPA